MSPEAASARRLFNKIRLLRFSRAISGWTDGQKRFPTIESGGTSDVSWSDTHMDLAIRK